MSQSKMFHESWYRIADQRICLRSAVNIRRQFFQGQKWYVLEDPLGNTFFRIRPEAWEFLSRLNGLHTVEDVWRQALERDPDHAPGQEELVQLLSQLYQANLLQYRMPWESLRLFERNQQRQRKTRWFNLQNIMFFRIPLLDPQPWLNRVYPFFCWIFSKLGAALWLAVLGFAIKSAVDHWQELQAQSQGILAPSNLLLLYLGLALVKTLHEFGHAMAVRHFGGETHVMGVMFMIFTPLPYVDASGAWAFRRKIARVMVGSAGMIVELFIAALAVFVWAATGPGLIHSLAYNIIFVASVSTVLFNINPLLRYDGYYILSDLLDIANMAQLAQQEMTYFLERYVFGMREAQPPVTSRKEAVWLTIYGILSGIYRFFLSIGILFFISDRFLLLGMLMGAAGLVSWGILPLIRTSQYLFFNPRLMKVRGRAYAVCGGGALAVILFGSIIPFPSSFKTTGVLEASGYQMVAMPVAGIIHEAPALSGSRVQRGTLLLRIENQELDWKVQDVKAAIEQENARLHENLARTTADIHPTQRRIAALQEQLDQLMGQQKECLVRAPIDAQWSAPNLANYRGMWLPRGFPVGQLVDERSFVFRSVVSEQDVSRIFANEILSSTVRLHGQAHIDIAGRSYVKIPMEQSELPSLALGWMGGGDIPVDVKDQSGRKSAEPFYELRVGLEHSARVVFWHGRSGVIRYNLRWEPLFKQGWRRVQQLLQKRYYL